MARNVEYKITYADGDIDHVSWRKAKALIANPTSGILLIERVTRYWQDEFIISEEAETLFERE